jgi:peptidyl-prolyl cis-trans isomerase B (cyclophilin B)
MDPNSSSLPPPQRKPHPQPNSACANVSSHLNGKHVVFGEVMEGYEIVEQIENFSKDGRDRPTVEVKIVKSGELPVPEEGIHVEL